VSAVACQSVRARFAHISGTGRPIDFVFDPRVGFSGTADRMDLLPVSTSPRWRLLITSSRNNRCRNFSAKYLGNDATDSRMVPMDRIQQTGHDLSIGHDPYDVGRRKE